MKTTEQKVDRAIQLGRDIADLEGQLAELKAELIRIAEGKDIEKSKTECGGWSAVLPSNNREICRVTKPADKLKASLAADSEEWAEVAGVLGPMRLIVFTRQVQTLYLPSKSIRENLISQGAEKRRRVLRLITTKAKASVSFETRAA